MPGENCSILGCGVCRRNKFAGVSIFRWPPKIDGDNEQEKWRNDFLAQITAARTVDDNFRRLIENGNVYVCERHFKIEDYNIYNGPKKRKKKLRKGAVPTINLPQNSLEVPNNESTCTENESKCFKVSQDVPEMSQDVPTVCEYVPPPPKEVYSSFENMCVRVISLSSLAPQWCISNENDSLILEKQSNKYVIPEYSIYVDKQMTYQIQVFGWKLPINNILYRQYGSNAKIICIYNLIREMKSMTICIGVDKVHSNNTKIVSHTIPFKPCLSLSMEQPFNSISYCRTSGCEILLTTALVCTQCSLFSKKEEISIKAKRKKPATPLKPKAPISVSSTEKLVATVRQTRLEKKELLSENATLQAQLHYLRQEISRNSIIGEDAGPGPSVQTMNSHGCKQEEEN